MQTLIEKNKNRTFCACGVSQNVDCCKPDFCNEVALTKKYVYIYRMIYKFNVVHILSSSEQVSEHGSKKKAHYFTVCYGVINYILKGEAKFFCLVPKRRFARRERRVQNELAYGKVRCSS